MSEVINSDYVSLRLDLAVKALGKAISVDGSVIHTDMRFDIKIVGLEGIGSFISGVAYFEPKIYPGDPGKIGVTWHASGRGWNYLSLD